MEKRCAKEKKGSQIRRLNNIPTNVAESGSTLARSPQTSGLPGGLELLPPPPPGDDGPPAGLPPEDELLPAKLME